MTPEYLEVTHQYPISRYRVSQITPKGDTLVHEGSIDSCIAVRELLLSAGATVGEFYFMAHFPSGHPDYPGATGIWVSYRI